VHVAGRYVYVCFWTLSLGSLLFFSWCLMQGEHGPRGSLHSNMEFLVMCLYMCEVKTQTKASRHHLHASSVWVIIQKGDIVGFEECLKPQKLF